MNGEVLRTGTNMQCIANMYVYKYTSCDISTWKEAWSIFVKIDSVCL